MKDAIRKILEQYRNGLIPGYKAYRLICNCYLQGA